MDQVMVIWTTVESSQDADRLAQMLVAEKLAACVQIAGPITSLYRWQGTVETTQEWRLTLKSAASLAERIEAFLAEHHPYDVPQIVCCLADRVSGPYRNWLVEQIDSESQDRDGC